MFRTTVRPSISSAKPPLRSCTAGAALVLSAVLLAGGGARADNVGPQGGPGGGVFAPLQCPANHYMLGVALRTGSWVDAIRANCLPYNASTNRFVRPPQFTAFTGGAGGALKQNGCPEERYVSAIKIGFTRDGNRPKFLDYVELTCTVLSGYGGDQKVCLDSGEGCWDRHPNPGPYNGFGLSFTVACPRGQAATGLIGRSGAYIDALGLMCAARPGPAPTPVGPPKQPPAVACAPNRGDPVPAEWKDMLDVHNERRKSHCVCPLSWSASLARAAQTYATECKIGVHGSYGENLATAVSVRNGEAQLPAKTHREAFEGWYAENKDYDFNNPRFDDEKPGVNGHFTQVVWKNSTQLGCGIATCVMEVEMKYSDGRVQKEKHKGTQWVCRYLPIGNDGARNQAVLRDQVKPATCR